MGDSFNNIINGAHDALDKVENSGITDSLGGNNTVLDPAPDISRTIADFFAAFVQILSFFSNMFKSL